MVEAFGSLRKFLDEMASYSTRVCFLNSKFEYRNPKQFQNSKYKTSKLKSGSGLFETLGPLVI